MTINLKREMDGINKLDMINSCEFDEEFELEDILAYYAYSLKIMDYENEAFLKNNNIYNYVLNGEREIWEENYCKFQNLMETYTKEMKSSIECINLVRVMSLKYKLNNMINSAAVILMYRGTFQEAFGLFNFNYKVNNDKVSKEYIHKLDEFNEFIFKYNSSIDLAKIGAYNEGIKILRGYDKKGWRTKKSDILLALLYYFNKNYIKCGKTLNSIHKSYKGSILYHMIYGELNLVKRKILGGTTLIILLLLTTGSLYMFKDNVKLPPKKEAKKNEIKVEKVVKKEPVVEKKPIPKEIPKEVNTMVVSKRKPNINYAAALKKLEKYVTNDDFASFEEVNDNIRYNDLTLEQKKIYDKLIKRYKRAAQPYYYYKGKNYLAQKNYDKSIECFKAAYKCKMDRSLDEHVLFYLAQSLQMKNDSRATAYYKEYLQTYKKGIYTYKIKKLLN